MKALRWIVVVLAALLLLAFAASFVVPPAVFRTEFVVRKPVEHAWSVMMDGGRTGEWMPGLRSIRTLSGEPLTVGSRHELVFVERGEEYPMIEVVTSFEEHDHMSFTLTHDIVESDVTIRFSDLGDGRTRVETDNLVRGKNTFMRLMMPLMAAEMERRQVEGYDSLAKLIEADE